MRWAAAIFALGLSLVAPAAFAEDASAPSAADTGSPPAAGEPAATPKAEPPPVDPPVIEVVPPKAVWHLGTREELKVRISHDPRLDVFFPDRPATPGFHLHELRDRRSEGPGGEVERVLTLVLVPMRMDAIRLPTVDVAWRRRDNADDAGTVPVELGRVTVVGAHKDPREASLAGPPKGLPVLHRNTALIVGAAALAAALAAVLLTLLVVALVRRFILGRAKPALPADVVALAALDELEANTTLLDHAPEQYVTRVSEILRAYLGGRFHFEALEATSTELLAWADASKPAGLGTLELKDLLSTMDLVKFARQATGGDEASSLLGRVREVVLRTREKAEERAAREARARALIPGHVERAHALGVDLVVGGVLAAGLHLAAGITKDPLLAIGGAVLLGAWMLLRDVASRSPGKVLAGLRIAPASDGTVRAGADSEEAVPAGTRALRNLLPATLAFLPAEVIAALLLPGGRRLGDLLARTRVLRVREGGVEVGLGVLVASWILAICASVGPPLWALMKLPGAGP